MAEQTEAPAAAVLAAAEGTDASVETETPAADTAEALEASKAQEAAEQAKRVATDERRRAIELAKKERRIFEETRKAKAEREAWEKQRRDFDEQRKSWEERLQKVDQWEKSQANARRQPLQFLSQAGLSLEDVVRAQLADGNPSPELMVRDVEHRSAAETKALREEILRIRKELEERDAKSQEAENRRAVQHVQQEIVSHLQANPDKYELTIELGQQSEVFELMRLAFQERNELLSVERAADLIEDYLFTQAKKASKAKKFAALFAGESKPASPIAQQGKAPAPQAKNDPDARAKSSTLTAKLVTSPAQPNSEETLLPAEDALAIIAKRVKANRASKK